MKKLFLCILMLSVVLFASSGFAGVVSHADYFDVDSGNYTVSKGTWSYVPYGSTSGNMIYQGTLTGDSVASSFLNRPGYANIETTGIHMEAKFGVPSVGTSVGIFIGLDGGNHHSIFVNNYLRESDGANFMLVGIDLNEQTNPAESSPEYVAYMGPVPAENTVYELEFDISSENIFSWEVSYRVGTTGDFTFLNSGTWTTGMVDPRSGLVGMFTQDDENAFGYFEVSGNASAVPVPGTMLLLGMGIVGLVGLKRR